MVYPIHIIHKAKPSPIYCRPYFGLTMWDFMEAQGGSISSTCNFGKA